MKSKNMVDLDEKNINTKPIYPSLEKIKESVIQPFATPSAPSAPIINTDDRGHSYRLSIIREIQSFLEKEIKERETLSKKYFRGAQIIHSIDNTLITITIGAEGTGAILMATGVGAPFALILSVGGVVTGAVSLIGNYFNKKATTKAEKHLKIKTLAAAKLDTILSHVSKAMMDNFINDEEFKLVVEEMDKYKAMKEEVRSKTKKILKTEEEESLIERGRQEARESFRKLVEKNRTI